MKVVRRQAYASPARFPGQHPVLARVYQARGLQLEDELDYSLNRLHSPESLVGLNVAVGLLAQALRENWRILVVGDFDADGATSTALALRCLRAMGARRVDYLVPDRLTEGYGLSPRLVNRAAERSPELLVTVDNGIASIAGVEAAKARGWRVIVTDHHLPGEVLPAADAIVNPNLPHCGFPSKHMAGVGVIFYVLVRLRATLKEQGWFDAGRSIPNLADFLDLVALGTVADVVRLDANNRVLVEQGLRRIRAGRACPGIQALLRVASRDPGRAVATDLSFAVGPRLNAAGRLTDMALGIECLLSDHADQALVLAARLDALNRERRDIEMRMKDEASIMLESLALADGEGLPWGLCLFDESWHPGVIGILASRVKESHHRPTIAFAPADDGQLRGSARSIPGFHIRDALAAVDSRHPGLLNAFGGHAMAAGLSLAADRLDDFSVAFDGQVRTLLNADDLEAVILSDGELAGSEFCLEVAELLQNGGPWGQGFAEPVFDGEFDLLDRRVLKDLHLKLRLRGSGGAVLEAIWFFAKAEFLQSIPVRLHVVYRLNVNEYRGIRSPQLQIVDMAAI
ncbi:MAG: single-stranded-DNA-specific exonuclease RecJ [Chromatiales bacterium]|nr:single-stranded-DNA-specific exonuclease RecJ [Chromatiales bacterium]